MTFKAIFGGAAAIALLSGSAFAADLPSYKAPPPAPPAVFDWTGYHMGISGGYGGGEANYLSNVTIFGTPAVVGGIAIPARPYAANNVASAYGTTGYVVGVQSGATWQLQNRIVVGYESDFSYSGVGSLSYGNANVGLHSHLRWLGTERLRFGYAFGRLLPYLTGGLAYGQTHVNGFDVVAGGIFSTSASNWQAGWTAGAGLEWAVYDPISIKAEYLYTSLQGPHGASAGVPAAFRTLYGNGFGTHIARVGINYNFKSFGALLGMPQLGI